jgi:hypothetical protein
MKKTEIIFTIIALAGLLLKCFHLPFGALLAVIGFFGLACFYMYFSFAFFNNIPLKRIFKKESYTTDISEKIAYRILISVSSGVSLSIMLIGLLFYFQIWPSAFFQINVGIKLIVPALIIGLIRFFKTKSTFYSRIFIRIAIIVGVALFFRLMPNSTWIEIQYRNHPSYVEALKNEWAYPDSIELMIKTDYEWDKIHRPEYIESMKKRVHELDSDSIEHSYYFKKFDKIYLQYIKEDSIKHGKTIY